MRADKDKDYYRVLLIKFLCSIGMIVTTLKGVVSFHNDKPMDGIFCVQIVCCFLGIFIIINKFKAVKKT